jgi:outer membrane protein LpxR
MRLAWLAIVLGCAGADCAAAQGLKPRDSAAALNNAAFATTPAHADAADRFLESEGYVLGKGPTLRQSSEVRLSSHESGAIDSVRVNIAGVLRTPGGLPLNYERGAFEPHDVDVTLLRRWPNAVSFSSDGLAFDVSPHAGVGVSNYGGQAEGGATLTVSKSREDQAVERLKDMGVKDGAVFGDTGRWYLFAAASGRAVGLNMLRDEHGWDRAGWSTDTTGALVGDAQIGVGWRKGDMQSSFGVIHREVKGQHMIFGQETRDDTVAAFTFSLRPQR